jgi:hypothetical protein
MLGLENRRKMPKKGDSWESYPGRLAGSDLVWKANGEPRVAQENRSLNHGLCGRGKWNRGVAETFAAIASTAKNIVEDLATLDLASVSAEGVSENLAYLIIAH